MRETSSVTHLPEPRERYGALMNYVDGEWVESKGETKPVDNPAKNTIIAEVSMSTRDALETAVQAARAAFAEWRETAPISRVRVFWPRSSRPWPRPTRRAGGCLLEGTRRQKLNER